MQNLSKMCKLKSNYYKIDEKYTQNIVVVVVVFSLTFSLWSCHKACGILVTWIVIKPALPALEAQRLQPGKFPDLDFFFCGGGSYCIIA